MVHKQVLFVPRSSSHPNPSGSRLKVQPCRYPPRHCQTALVDSFRSGFVLGAVVGLCT